VILLNRPDLLREQAYVGGEWVGADRTFAIHDPATGAPIANVPDLTAQDMRRAIDAADVAMKGWAAKTARERALVLRRWFDLMLAHQDDLAAIMTAEQGKPLAEAKGEIVYGASFIEWFAEEGKRVYGDVVPTHAADRRILTLKQPIGVCGAITPWNFPVAMITRKAGPALAAGCAMVLKPAEQTPLSALALAVLAEEAGLPAGLLSVVTTSDAKAIGGEITSNPRIAKISFTGSTEVGKLLMTQCAGTVKKVSLELGGNAPFIVFDDADLDEAVKGAIASKFRNAGQTCVCANRLYVQDAIYERFVERLTQAVAALHVGIGTEPGVDIGPLIDDDALSKVEAHLADALEHGAKVTTGGARHELGGHFFQPTVIAEMTPDMRIATEETFGPLAPIFRFSDEADAIAQANATRFGLAAYFYARDLGRVWRVAEALEYGIVGINTGIISTEVAPFGGVKESGIGREGSRYGIDDYVEIKYLAMAGIQ